MPATTTKYLNRLRDLWISILILSKRKLFGVNLALAILLLILIIFNIFKANLDNEGFSHTYNNIRSYIDNNISDLSQYTTVFRNIFTALGIIVAGLWGYYVFVKGRTFTPKLNIDISQQFLCGENNDIIIIRCTVKNIGRIRVTPNYAIARIYYGKMGDTEIEYVLFEEKGNILEQYTFEEGECLYLEPTDEMHVDFEVFLRKIESNIDSGNLKNPVLLVKVAFVDVKYHVWQQNTTLLVERLSTKN